MHDPCPSQRDFKNHMIPRARSGLGGSHTVVTSIPLDALRPLTDPKAVTLALHPVNDLHLYFHIAFCEHVCGFCHYAKSHAGISDEGSETRAYMRALMAEVELRRPLIEASQVRSIYVGGGTPTVLPPRTLSDFLGMIGHFRKGKTEPFCVEASPLTLAAPDGREKLQVLKEAGVNRISIGVQSFSRHLLQKHRGHGPEILDEVFARLAESGVEVNVDMMQDLPEQTAEDLDIDLEWIDKLRPSQVTWYVLRFDRGSSWNKLRQTRGLPGVPAGRASVIRRMRLFNGMGNLGYNAQAGGRFLRDAVGQDTFKTVRNGLDSSLLGLGVSSYSHGWGRAFRNLHEVSSRAAVRAYVGRMDRGEDPIDTGHILSEADRVASRRLVAIRTRLPQALVGGADAESGRIRRLLGQLAEADLVSRQGDDWRLTCVGRALEEEIASLFFAPEVRQTLADAGQYWPADRPGLLPELLALTTEGTGHAQVA